MTEADAVKIIGKRLFGNNTDWHTVEEAIRDIVKAMEGKTPEHHRGSRVIDADKLIHAFESDEDSEESLWTLYGIKRRIEDVVEGKY